MAEPGRGRSVTEIFHQEILRNDYTITADLYCQQLDRIAAKIQEK